MSTAWLRSYCQAHWDMCPPGASARLTSSIGKAELQDQDPVGKRTGPSQRRRTEAALPHPTAVKGLGTTSDPNAEGGPHGPPAPPQGGTRLGPFSLHIPKDAGGTCLTVQDVSSLERKRKTETHLYSAEKPLPLKNRRHCRKRGVTGVTTNEETLGSQHSSR